MIFVGSQNKKGNRRVSSEQKPRVSAKLLAKLGVGALTLGALGIAATLTLGSLDQNITQVSVTGRFQRVSPIEVEQAVKARVRDTGLISVDLSAVQRAAATCSTTRIFNARGHWRSTVAVSTHGSCSTARRTAARSSGESDAGYFGSRFTVMPILPFFAALVERNLSTASPCARIRLCVAIGASKRFE